MLGNLGAAEFTIMLPALIVGVGIPLALLVLAFRLVRAVESIAARLGRIEQTFTEPSRT